MSHYFKRSLPFCSLRRTNSFSLLAPTALTPCPKLFVLLPTALRAAGGQCLQGPARPSMGAGGTNERPKHARLSHSPGACCAHGPLRSGFLPPISHLGPGPGSPQGLASPPSLHPAMMAAAVSREPWFRAQTLRSELPGFKPNGLGQACCPTVKRRRSWVHLRGLW